nr:MAG TPA: hypothetical protein [Caudoviricetes sp.]
MKKLNDNNLFYIAYFFMSKINIFVYIIYHPIRFIFNFLRVNLRVKEKGHCKSNHYNTLCGDGEIRTLVQTRN